MGGQQIDTSNDQLAGRQGDYVIVVLPNRTMSPDEAVRHAAWLVLMAGAGVDQFCAVLEAIRST